MHQLINAPAENAPVLVLAHGAGAGQRHPWMRRVAESLVAHGISVATFDFPYMAAKRSAPDPGPVLEAAFAEVWKDVVRAVGRPSARFFAGGKSMGGRISSQAAAKNLFDPAPAGLVFFGYPLHPPGKSDQRRDRHLPDVTSPMLFLHGTRDPFGSPDEMTALVATLPRATLEILDGGDHSLVASKAQEAKDSRLERAIDLAARWIKPGGRNTEVTGDSEVPEANRGRAS
jgi:predicted alpha/beta-hydrolase family hydrolase